MKKRRHPQKESAPAPALPQLMMTQQQSSFSVGELLQIAALLKIAVNAHQAGQLEQAEVAYLGILDMDVNHLHSLTLLGLLCLQRGEHARSVVYLERSLTIDPKQPNALNNLATSLSTLERHEAALDCYDRALLLNPSNADTHYNRGLTLKSLNRHEDALASHEQAIALNPNKAETHNNKGVALYDIKRYEEAVASYETAIHLKPDYADAYYNLGIALNELGRFEKAVASLNQATQFNPNYAAAYWNKSLIQLLLGEYTEGWELYEWRWKYAASGLIEPYPLAQRWFRDIPLHGKTLLLHAEQGMGDCIQFSRYILLLAQQGAHIILKTVPALKDLMQTLPCELSVITDDDPLPAFDLHYPLLSLPHALNTTVESIPCSIPYLSANSDKLATWSQCFKDTSKPNIGLVWSGSTALKNDHNRGLALELLEPLFAHDYTFHSLQKDVRPDDQIFLLKLPQLQQHKLTDFSDTSAVIMQMDLVISVDTSVAHLTGALGKPVWILLPTVPDWRWMLHREDTPWYPSARLFRQGSEKTWPSVIQNVIAALASTFP